MSEEAKKFAEQERGSQVKIREVPIALAGYELCRRCKGDGHDAQHDVEAMLDGWDDLPPALCRRCDGTGREP